MDNEVGAAGATGQGEIIMQQCGAFLAVELMRQGRDPTAACVETVERIVRAGRRHPSWSTGASFVALAKDGRHGAAGTERSFTYALTIDGQTRLKKPEILRI